ncbi:DUF397 domain-containing protein [Actinophytocola sp.]|uniref:DUF397 domain-containing protein n=1 Tax=Actinophytocola sp. TaxID=1872138 RepID=UPI002ED359AF
METQTKWRKSSRSTSDANCLEVVVDRTVTAVRDSKNPTGPTLAFPAASWKAFLQA